LASACGLQPEPARRKPESLSRQRGWLTGPTAAAVFQIDEDPIRLKGFDGEPHGWRSPANLAFIVRYNKSFFGFLACEVLFLLCARLQPRLGIRTVIVLAALLCFGAGALGE
jgi:hypothetical protein